MDDPRPLGTTEPPPGEADLLAGLRAGDGAAFEALVRLHCGRLLAVARRILGHEEDAREAVQDALLSAFRGVAAFDGAARLSTWLHRIAVNASLMKLRRRRAAERPIEPLLPRFLDDGHQADPPAPWPEPVERLLERAETRALVRSAVERLPEPYRTVLVLRDLEELDTEETARLLGVTAGVVKTRLHRARQALRSLLDPQLRGGDA
jgi:RNA polymerase sigma-70 factor (ECF subfamily)